MAAPAGDCPRGVAASWSRRSACKALSRVEDLQEGLLGEDLRRRRQKRPGLLSLPNGHRDRSPPTCALPFGRHSGRCPGDDCDPSTQVRRAGHVQRDPRCQDGRTRTRGVPPSPPVAPPRRAASPKPTRTGSSHQPWTADAGSENHALKSATVTLIRVCSIAQGRRPTVFAGRCLSASTGGVGARTSTGSPSRWTSRAPACATSGHRGSTRRGDRVRIGLTGRPSTTEKLVEQAKAAEKDGFSSIWLDSTALGDPLAAMAVARRETSSIGLGTAVLQTYPCHPLLQANRAAAAAEAMGRPGFTLGIGPSHEPRISGMYGLSYDRPGCNTEEHLRILTSLLRGEVVTFEGEDRTARGAQVAVKQPVPVLVAALGPRLLRVAGELADGVVLFMASARAIETHVAPRLRAAAAAAGRPEPRIVAGLPVACTMTLRKPGRRRPRRRPCTRACPTISESSRSAGRKARPTRPSSATRRVSRASCAACSTRGRPTSRPSSYLSDLTAGGRGDVQRASSLHSPPEDGWRHPAWPAPGALARRKGRSAQPDEADRTP